MFFIGHTYSKLRPIFQKYVLHEADAHKKLVNWIQAMNSAMVKGCEKSCPEVSGSSIEKCKHEMCSHDKRYVQLTIDQVHFSISIYFSNSKLR